MTTTNKTKLAIKASADECATHYPILAGLAVMEAAKRDDPRDAETLAALRVELESLSTHV